MYSKNVGESFLHFLNKFILNQLCILLFTQLIHALIPFNVLYSLSLSNFVDLL